MNDSQFIFKCDYCGASYCGNCSDASLYLEFCSIECEHKYNLELKGELSDDD